MSRIEKITRAYATRSWRVKTAGSLAIVAGFCSTVGAFQMHLSLGDTLMMRGFLPMVILAGILTTLAGLLFTRGMQEAAALTIWLTMFLGIGGAAWNTYAFEAHGVYPISIAASMCSAMAFILAPMAWMEIRQIRQRAFCRLL